MAGDSTQHWEPSISGESDLQGVFRGESSVLVSEMPPVFRKVV